MLIIETKILEKFEYLARMFNVRTKDKDYENYVVNAIYNRVGNPELVPVTQQFVRNSNDPRRYYLLDLYFPQLNYGIEVDERQHLDEDNIISDKIREQDIRDAISCEEGRIELFIKVDSSKKAIRRSYVDIEKQINDEVEKIKKKIKEEEAKKTNGEKLIWQTNEELKAKVFDNGTLSAKDDVDYKGITEIYNLLGHKVKRLGTCFLSLNNDYYLWIPTMAIDLGNGKVRSSYKYENYLNENHDMIIEYDKTDTRFKLDEKQWDGSKKRVVFMKMRDRFGKNCIKFIGVFEANGYMPNGGRRYKRISESVEIADLKKVRGL